MKVLSLEGLWARLRSEKIVVFDWDDTLVHSRSQLGHALAAQAVEEGFYNQPTLHLYEEIVPPKIPDNSYSLLHSLSSSGVELHLISNKKHSLVLKEVEMFGLTRRFLTIQGDANKPNDPSLLTKIASTGVYVGDQITDLIFASRAGWEFEYTTADIIRSKV